MEPRAFLFEFNTDLAQPLTESRSAHIDTTNGVIYGVSLITSGLEARGHSLEVDKTTLKQMLAAADAKGQVSVKTNHGTGADAVNGYLTNFRVEGKKLLADWHLLKSHPQYNHIVEMASRMPKNVGLSAAFMGLPETGDGKKVYRGDDADPKWRGKFYTEGTGGRKVECEEKKFARCDELVSVDLVAQPAANPDGLFESRVDNHRTGMAKNNQQAAGGGEGGEQAEPTLADVLGAIQEMRGEFNERMEAMEAFQNEFLDAQGEEEGEEESEGEGEEGFEGEGDEAGEMVGAGAEHGHGFQRGTLGAVLTQFSARLNEFERREKDAVRKAELSEQQHAFDVISTKIDEVTAFAEQLVAKNEAQQELITELQAQVKQTRAASVGTETFFNTGTASHGYESRVQELVKSGKTRGEAVELARKEDPQRYANYLQAKGVFAKPAEG